MSKTIVALVVVLVYMWLSRAKQYPCSTVWCPNPCFADGDLCRECREWHANVAQLGPMVTELKGVYS